MEPSKRFSYRSLGELTDAIAARGLDLPTCEDLSVLAEAVRFGRLTVPNRLVVQPMEGCDGTPAGGPTDLTVRKYERFGAGGAGMIWWEACAVDPKGKANPRQLYLCDETVDAFAEMVRATRAAARQAVGYEPVCVLQLTHSGRYSRPVSNPAPIIAHHSAVLDGAQNLPADYPLISDDELNALQAAYVAAARLAARAGFDAVDIKSCHRYLISELLASFTREDSRYGGDFDNRTRFLRETVAKVRQAVGESLEVTCRLNAYDAIAHPFGWGVDADDPGKPDLAEPIRLVGLLKEAGFGGINITIGNPYWNPYVNRPADWMIAGSPDPPEDPLTGVARIIHVVREIQQAHPETAVVGSGYTWLRQYVPQFAAGAISAGWASLVGLGRGALAYPDFARDVLQGGAMDPHKVCVVCSSCTQIMRDHGRSGCVVRDHDVYGPIFRAGRRRDLDVLKKRAAQCRRCPDAMCIAACPAGVDIPGFLGALADGREREAYRILRAGNTLPEICGAVCPVEVQCQAGCIRNYLADGPIPIGQIQQYLSERAVEAGWAALAVPEKATGRRVAVVGAGPAGLSASAGLLQRGHAVTVLDGSGQVGGKLGSVIPTTRLSAQRAMAEIHAIFDSVPADRLTWRLNGPLSAEFTLDDLLAEGFDAVVLAMGLGGGASLLGDAARPQGVLEANDFLRQMNRHPDHRCPNRVAVIGGGNTAMDAAVCAARGGARDVFLVYRRSYSQMPAWPAERAETLEAGVHPMLLCQPQRYVTDRAGRLSGVAMLRTELGEPDASGRRRPMEVAGSEFTLDVEMAVEAIGERMDGGLSAALSGVAIDEGGLVQADPETLATSRPGVWAAGDLINGGATVVKAVAEGCRAAEQIDVHFLAGGPEEI